MIHALKMLIHCLRFFCQALRDILQVTPCNLVPVGVRGVIEQGYLGFYNVFNANEMLGGVYPRNGLQKYAS